RPKACRKLVRGHPEPLRERGEGDFKRLSVERTALEATRRAATEHLPHENSEIEAARVNQQAFEDVRMSPQMSAAHRAGVVHVSEGSFHVLAAATQQALAAGSAHAPASARGR